MSRVDVIAKVCHEANKAYCESLGDFSQASWNEAPDWQKKSVISGVINVLENPDVSPSASHENWLKEKMADGWKYGTEKDHELKTHPCIVNYNRLPYEQRFKDSLFISIVKAFVLAEKEENKFKRVEI